MREQDAHILDGRDQVILDLLTPEPPPASSFEVMIVGRIGKTALDQCWRRRELAYANQAPALDSRASKAIAKSPPSLSAFPLLSFDPAAAQHP